MRRMTSLIFWLAAMLATNTAHADSWAGKWWSYAAPFRLDRSDHSIPAIPGTYPSESALIEAYDRAMRSVELVNVPYTCKVHIGDYTVPSNQSAGAGLFLWGEPWASYAVIYLTGCHENSILNYHYEYVYAKGYPYDADRALGINGCQNTVVRLPAAKTFCGNPINALGGNKYQPELDFEFSAIRFSRFYNSRGDSSGHGLGRKWTHSYSSAVLGTTEGMLVAGTQVFYVERPEGGRRRFIYSNDRFTDEQGAATRRLRPIVDGNQKVVGWEYGEGADITEIFDGNGRLVSVLRKDGQRNELSYDPNDSRKLASVRDQTGRSIQFVYFAGGDVERIISAGRVLVRYAYNSDGMLASATYADDTRREYVYNESSHTSSVNAPWLLTSIKDENAVTYASFTYSSDGAATNTAHAGGADAYTVAYPDAQDGVVDVSLPAGGTRRIDVDYVNGYQAVSSVVTDTGDSIRTQSYGYDSRGRLQTYTDQNDADTDLEYSPFGSVSGVIYSSNDAPNRRYVTQEWDEDLGLLARVTIRDASSGLPGIPIRSVGWTYNSRGQTISATVEDRSHGGVARTTSTTYCESADVSAGSCPMVGLVKAVDGPRVDVVDTTRYAYFMQDAQGCATNGAWCSHRKGDLRSITDGLGHVQEVLAYDDFGRRAIVSDPNGVRTESAYDLRGRLLSRIVRGDDDGTEIDDRIVRFEYWPTGTIRKVIEADGSSTRYGYDDAHRLTSIEDESGNRIEFVLDAAGQRVSEATSNSAGTLLRTLSRTFNTLGQVETETDAYEHVSRFGYDPVGNRVSTIDPQEHETVNEYDALSRLIRTLEDVDGVGAETRRRYDVLDNLVEIIDPKGLRTNYDHDGFGDLLEVDSPDSGSITYAYDEAGNRVAQTDARGIAVHYGYDASNRLVSATYPTSTLDTYFTYDASSADCAPGETFSIGRLTSVSDASGSTSYCYDRFGNVVRKVQRTDDMTLTMLFARDPEGRLVDMVYPDGTHVDYAYGIDGGVTEIGVQPPGGVREMLVTNVAYMPFGPSAGWRYGNGREMSRTFDLDYRPERISVAAPGGLDIGYRFDAAGNVASIHHAALSDPPRRRYEYDGLNRLTAVRDGASLDVLDAYAYDATGNRLSASRRVEIPAGPGSGSATFELQETPYSYGPDSHRLLSVGGEPRAYDEAGNLVRVGALDQPGGPSMSYQFDDRGRLSRASNSGGQIASYSYNGRGERVRASVSASGGVSIDDYSLYDGEGRWVGTYDASGRPSAQVIWLGDLPVGLLAGSGRNTRLLYIEPDALGSPRNVIDPNRGSQGVAIWNWDVAGEAFGDAAPTDDPDADGIGFELAMRFPGQNFDRATGANYNYFRDYDPRTGRYLESDPIGLEGGMSTYAYVSGQPLRYKDPFGLVRWEGKVFASNAGNMLGIGWYRFKLVSQCVGGKRATVGVRAWGGGAVAGPVPLSANTSSITFEDYLAEIRPDNFNGVFGTIGFGASAILIGGGCGAYQLGNQWTPAVSSFSCGRYRGVSFDGSVSVLVGQSTLEWVEYSDCDDCGPILTPFDLKH